MNNDYFDTLHYYALQVGIPDELQMMFANEGNIFGPNGLRKIVAEQNVEAFLYLYFGIEFTTELSPAHYKMLDDIQQVRDRLIAKKQGLKVARAYPRGFGKSTYYSKILPIWGFLYGFWPVTVLIANNDIAARRLVMNIKETIETNEAIIEDFPDIRGESWGNERLQNKDGAVITAYGINSGSLRGTSNKSSRPSIILVDDAEDDLSVRSGVQIATNKDTFDKAIMAMGDNVTYTTSFIVVGTIIRKTSLMKYILDSADFDSIVEQRIKRWSSNDALWRQWEAQYLDLARNGNQPKDASEDVFYQENKTALLQDTEVLWNKPDEYYYAMVYKLARGNKAFNSEMQNTPEESDSMLRPTFIPQQSINETEYDVLAALDPTIQGGKSNDLAAYVELLYHRRTKKLIVWYVDAKRRSYTQTIDAVVNRIKSRGIKYNAFFVEDNAHGLIVKDLINQRFRQERIPLLANGIYNTIPKNDRIGVLSVYMERGDLVVVDTIAQELKDEFDNWPISGTDDVLDAISIIVLYAKEHDLLPQIDIPNR